MAELHPLGSLKAGLFWRSPCVIGHVDWPEARALVDRGLLTPAEEVRAAAFRVDHARHAFVLGRAILRHGLALATGAQATEITIEIEPTNKPVAPETGWHFSISHSGPWVAVAFSRLNIGCDLETGGSLRGADLAGLARQVFCPLEVDRLAALAGHPADQRAFFLNVWRRKEAVLKASEQGLTGQPRSLCVVTETGMAEHVNHADRTYRITDLSGPGLPVVTLASAQPDRT